MARIVTFNGQQHVFPDEATDEQIKKALLGSQQAATHTGPTTMTQDTQQPSEFAGEGPVLEAARFGEGARKGLGRVGVGAAEAVHAVSPEVAAAARKELTPNRGEDLGATAGEILPALAIPAGPAGEGLGAVLGRIATQAGGNAVLAAAQSGNLKNAGPGALMGAAAGGAGELLRAAAPAVRSSAGKSIVKVLAPAANEQQVKLAVDELAPALAADQSPEALFQDLGQQLSTGRIGRNTSSLLDRAKARTATSRAALEADTAAAARRPVNAQPITDQAQLVRESHEVTGGAPMTSTRSVDIKLTQDQIDKVRNDLAQGYYPGVGAAIDDVANGFGVSRPEAARLLNGGTIQKPITDKLGPLVAHPQASSHAALGKLDTEVGQLQERTARKLAKSAGVDVPTDASGAVIPAPQVPFEELYGFEGGKLPQKGQTAPRSGLLQQYDNTIRSYRFDTGRGPAPEGSTQAQLEEMAGILRGERRNQFPDLEQTYRQAHQDIGAQDFIEQRKRGEQLPSSSALYDNARAATELAKMATRPTTAPYTLPLWRRFFASTRWNYLGAGVRKSIANRLESGDIPGALTATAAAFSSEAAAAKARESAGAQSNLEDRQRAGVSVE